MRRDESNLKKLLKEQIEFISMSCKSFDNGFINEAKRIATCVRILVHDTDSSISLLSQLRFKDTKFYNTASEYRSTNLLVHMGLVSMRLSTNQDEKYVAFLDDGIPNSQKLVKFDDWWNKIVIKDFNKNTFTRRDIILKTCNKEGGAHIDPNLDMRFNNLLRNNSINWYVAKNNTVKASGKDNE